MKNLVISVTVSVSLLFALTCIANSYYSQDTSSSEMLKFSSGAHVIGFQPSKVSFIQADHVLNLEFIAANSVAPQVKSKGTLNNREAFEALGRIEYPNLWSGITARYEADEQGIAESVYFVEPGADVTKIRFKYNSNVSLEEDGSLRHTLLSKRGWMTEPKPIAWQEIDGKHVDVAIEFIVANNQVGFLVADYDKKHTLIIDPVYQWHSFHDEVPGTITDIAVDDAGNIYVTGLKAQFSGAFGASTSGEIEGTAPLHAYSGEEDMVVVKFNSSGVYQWHTFYGSGDNSNDETSGIGIALDSQNNVYITGVSSREMVIQLRYTLRASPIHYTC